MTLHVAGVTAGYGSVTAIREVNIDVAADQVVAILGANGAGKTTLLRTISGLVRPTSGQVHYRDRVISGQRPHTVARQGIAHVPEKRELFARLTVLENLELGGSRLDRTRRRTALERVLNQFPLLAERADQVSGTMSGGQQQLLAIARAMMSEPTLLVLDEPSLGLAPKVVEEIFMTIERIHGVGVAVLLVEQHARQALDVADVAYVLKGGRVVIDGTADDVRQHPQLREAYLGL